MFGQIIKHHRECVEIRSIDSFKKLVAKYFNCTKNEVSFDGDNEGVVIWGDFIPWDDVCSVIEEFDGAEIITDKNENEKVMTWLNVD